MIATREELLEWNGLSGCDPIEHRKVGGRHDADVVAVLTIDALEAFRDDQPDAG